MKDALVATSVIRRADYAPLPYRLDHVDLTFDLDPTHTRVRAVYTVRRAEGAAADAPLVLMGGKDVELEAILLDGRPLAPDDYARDGETLTIRRCPEAFTLRIETRIDPANNTALEGLYMSGGAYVTQCEAEGFRHIVFHPDRPDVLSTFTTTIIADETVCPVLLSNGNRVASGVLTGGRHYARFEDPFRKPSYLFALVAGDFARLDATHTTRSGRTIALEIYAAAAQIGKCRFALDALKRAMTWEEETYGFECDLDRYAIVAVDDFNAGAMENKGLNIFNSEFILVDPATATDDDALTVEAVVGHEYFHNLTGNRLPVRDWFQLSLKEGLTVFREQEFSADQNSRAVKRIEDVRALRAEQFPEDEGAMAHPVRPDVYQDINNFYTSTVYDKGAEVVRMLHTLVGPARWRKAIDLYAARFDGVPATCDDLVAAVEDASGRDLRQFRLWYSQSGTPRVSATTAYDAASRRYALTLRQETKPTPDQAEKHPLHISLRVGLIGRAGRDLPLRLEGEAEACGTERVLELTEAEQTFVFADLDGRPVLSLNRGFSAPVILTTDATEDDLVFRLAHDRDSFNRWDAGQTLQLKALRDMALDPAATVPATIVAAIGHVLADTAIDPKFKALLLAVPGFSVVADTMTPIGVEGILRARTAYRQAIARAHGPALRALYETFRSPAGNLPFGVAAGQRALRDTALAYLASLDIDEVRALCREQLATARCMTDTMSAFELICDGDDPARATIIADVYARWRHEKLVVDKWFAAQAAAARPTVLAETQALLAHPDYDPRNPNRFESVVGAFAGNPTGFHAADGSGYRFVADQALSVDTLNPQTAAKFLRAFERLKRFDAVRQSLMRAEIARVAAHPGLSEESREVATRILEA